MKKQQEEKVANNICARMNVLPVWKIILSVAFLNIKMFNFISSAFYSTNKNRKKYPRNRIFSIFLANTTEKPMN